MAEELVHQHRYRVVAAMLDDCAALARLAHSAAEVAASEEPRALALAGGRRLRAGTRIGIFAGSFNPLTRAHVALVNAARRAADLDVVVWACAVASVDKERVERAALVDRLAQMRAFVAGRRRDALVLLNRGLYVDEARTIHTLLMPAASLVFLVGFDKIEQIFDHRYYANRDAALHTLFSLAEVLVAPRADAGADALAALLAQPENRQFARHVRYLDVSPSYALDSSTEARALAEQTFPDVAALASLLPPAGMALALQTDAYRHVSSARRDFYETRVRWLDAFALLPYKLVRQLPPLSALVRQTLRNDARGHKLRAWQEARRYDAAALSALLRGRA